MQIPPLVVIIMGGIAKALGRHIGQRGIGLVAEHGESPFDETRHVGGHDAEILRFGTDAHREAHVKALFVPEASRTHHLIEKRVDRELEQSAVEIDEVDPHVGIDRIGHVDEHLHDDLVAIGHRIGEKDAHAVDRILALDVEDLGGQFGMDDGVDARSPLHHVQLDGQPGLGQGDIAFGALDEEKIDLTHAEAGHHHDVVRLRRGLEGPEREQMRGDFHPILQTRGQEYLGIGAQAIKGHLKIDLAVSVAHAFQTNVQTHHLSCIGLRAKNELSGSRLGL